MSDDTWKTLVGIAGLVILIACVTAGVLAQIALKRARFSREWAPLIPIISGTIVNEDNGVATSSVLTGTYQGRKVQASMTPGRNRSSIETDSRGYNSFEIELSEVAGGRDWEVAYQPAALNLGEPDWQIITQDKALERRLRDSGVPALIAGLGSPKVTYRPRQSTLVYSADSGARWAPTPERFQEELDTLLRLAKLNEEVNPV